jgi:hypothetical protein
MGMGRWGHRGAAILLGGGWLLLFNEDPKAPNAPLSAWEEVGSFESPYMCEQGRVKAVLEYSKRHAGGGVPHSSTLQPIALRYRCARVEQARPQKPKQPPPSKAPAPAPERTPPDPVFE